MADLEEVSVDVEVAPSAEPVQVEVPVVTEAEPSSESVHDDERVFTPSTKIGNAEDYNRQQVAEENGTALGNGGVDGRTVTEVGRQAKAAAAEDEKDRKLDSFKQSEALRKEKEDNFGMSSHDLTKLLDFISNPELQEKLKARLVKGGMDEKRAKKAIAELDEFNQLKKKQDSGVPLTDLEKARMAELRKSEDLKVVIQVAQDMQNRRNERDLATGGTISKEIGEKIEAAEVGTQATSSRENTFNSFASSGITTEPITDKYNVVAAANKNEPKTPAVIVAQPSLMANKTAEVAGAGFTV